MEKQWKGLVLTIVLGLGFSGSAQEQKEGDVKLFLCGDVMTGRGIDQVLPQSVKPVLYESFVKDARDYVLLAEEETGKIDRPVSYDYIWGDALEVWQANDPALKLINLETSITTYGEPWPGKGINYRMHPENVEVLTTAGIDHCSLANNHTMDWGRPGLKETMQTLRKAGIAFSGVGDDKQEAEAPSALETDEGRVLVFSYGSRSSGIPRAWAAGPKIPGVNLLPDQGEHPLREIKANIESYKKVGDIVVFSVHWGGNWGYEVGDWQRRFAQRLIDEAGVDIVFGHSSHHPMGMEVHNNKLIMYGAGDFINDYEGISGQEAYRGELTLMYFPQVNGETGELNALKMVPMEIKNFRLNKATEEDAQWMENVLDREGQKLGTSVRREDDNTLWLEW